jgi:hypothetical protein
MQLADSESPNWVGRIAADLQKWQREIDARLGECREFSVYEGICACLEDTLPDYGQALEWLSCRLENEEGLYRHRNDQAEETLMWVGLGTENSERRLDELGYFDPAVFDALEEYEMVFKGRNYPNEPWAARWTGVPFWFFKHVSRE